MSKVVDEKVVEMRFDNGKFEKNVQTTLNTLDKLKAKLNLTGASKGLEAVQASANKMSFSNVESSLGSLEKRFSTMGIVGMTVIQNLTTSAMTLAKKLTGVVTGGILEGGKNRAMKLQNARFQLQGLMKDATKVEAVMKDVNYGVQDTAYSLDAAASVAAQLAASGMEAGDGMRKALRGISGVAAMTNSSYEDIGRIYTQVAGQGRLMGDQLLQLSGRGMNAAATLAKALNKSEAEIRDMVSKGKIDFATFAKAMDDAFGEHAKEANRTFNGALSNIRAALAKIGAEFYEPLIKIDGPVVNLLNAVRESINEVKADVIPFISELANNVGNVIDGIAKKIKTNQKFRFNPFADGLESDGKTTKFSKSMETIQMISEKTGMSIEEVTANIEKLNTRFLIFNSIKNIGSSLVTVFSAINKSFKEVFSNNNQDSLFNMFAGFNKLTTSLKNGVAANAEKISKIFKGLFSVIDVGITVVKSFVSGVGKILSALTGVPGGILGVAAAFSEYLTKIRDVINETNVLGKVFDTISNFMSSLIDGLKKFVGGFGGALMNTIKGVARIVTGAIGTIFGALTNALRSGDASKFMDLLNKGLFSLVLLKVKNFINYLGKGGTIFDTLKKFVGSLQGISDSIGEVLSKVGGVLKAWQQELQAKTLFKIAAAIGVLALSLTVLSEIDKDKLQNALSAVTTLFIDLAVALKVLSAGTLKGGASKMTVLVGLATSISILAGAMKKIADLNTDELVRTVLAITVLVKVMSKAMRKMATDSKMAIKGSAGIIALAVGVKILASACKDLAFLDLDELAKGLVGITILLGELFAFIKFSNGKDKGLIKVGTSMILISIAIKTLAKAVEQFGQMSWDGIARGLSAMAGVLAEIWAFQKFSGNIKKLLSVGIALNIVVLAIKGLVEPFTSLAKLDWDSIFRGLSAIGGMMLIMVSAIGALTWIAEKGGLWGGINMNFAAMSIDMLAKLMDKMVEAFEGFSRISWEGIAKSLLSIAVSLGILIVATKKLSDMNVASLIVCALALNVLAKSIALLATAGLPGVAAGLVGFAGVFGILYLAMKGLKPLIPTMFKIAGAIAAFSGSFVLLAVSMTALSVGLTTFVTGLILAFAGFSGIGWDTIAKGLVGIAGAFIVIGVAAKLLAPMTLSIIGLAGSIALFGLSCAAVGVGVSLIVSALATMATVGKEGAEAAGVAVKSLIVNVLQTIPEAVKQFGLALMELLKVVRDTMPLIGEVVKSTVFMLVDVLVQCAPNIAEGFFSLIVSGLQLLVQYTPQIANLLFDFMIGVLNVLGTRSPEFVSALVGFLGNFFDAVCEAFNKIDVDKLYKGIVAIGIISVALHLIAGLVRIIPKALLGVLAFGVLIAELGLVIAAVGLLTKIPGFKDLVTEGGNVLQLVGTAIGQFIGGIAGGIAKGMSSVLPDVAKNLSDFMTNLQPFLNGMKNVGLDIVGKTVLLGGAIAIFSAAGFLSSIMQFLTGGVGLPLLGIQLSAFMIGVQPFLEGVRNIDPTALENVTALSKAILVLTAANLINNISNFLGIFTGGNSLAGFGVQIALMGAGLRKFVDNIGTFTDEQVKTIHAACDAIKTLSSAASEIPNSGGLAALFAGDNDIGVFGAKLPLVGICLRGMVNALGTFSDGEIKTIDAAANAIKTLSSAGSEIPNSGGLAALFAGDNDIATFSVKLPILGACLAGFVGALGTFGDGEINKIQAASNAIKVMASAANEIPNSGGLVTLFTGDNDIAMFGAKMPIVGACLKGFVNNLGTFGDDQIKTIQAASNAIKVMASAANEIPNSGGLVTLFTGDNDIAMFGAKMPIVGACLKGFVDNLGTFGDDQIKTAECAAKVISTMAKVTSDIPASNGLAQLFTGQSDISLFAWKLPGVATHLNGFITNIGEFGEDKIKTAECAAKVISTLASVQVPATGGLKQLFEGESDISLFAWKLPGVATHLASFVSKLDGFSEAQVTIAKYAAEVLTTLAAVQVPPAMGLKQLFEGESDISLFAWKLPGVATHLKQFIENIGEFSEDKVNTAKAGAEALAAMASVDVPTTNGGFKKLFEGDNDISKFAGKFPGIGTSLKEFISNIGSYEPKNLDVIKLAVKSLSAMAELGKIDIKSTGGNLEEFGARMISFANKIKEFLEGMNGVDGEAIKSAISKINELIGMAKTIASENIESLKTFAESLGNIGKDSITAFVNAFKDQQPKTDASNAINDIIQEVINRAMGRKDDLVARAEDLVKAVLSVIQSSKVTADAGNAGKFFVQGFANGIRNNLYLARDAGSEVGRKALEAAKASIDSHSPSRETYKLGEFFDLGFVNGIKAFGRRVYSASSDVGDEAKMGLAKAISRISDIVENDMEGQPTIRPILDLSDVENGANSIGSMFKSQSLAVATNIGAISSGMSRNRQNGNSDVVSAIDKLRKDLGNVKGDTYNVGDVSYDDGTNVSDSVRSLVRAVRVERRK